MELPRPYQSMSASELDAFIRAQVRWTPTVTPTTHRHCNAPGSPPGTGPDKTLEDQCQLEIQAAEGVKDIVPENALPANGYVVARLTNVGTAKEHRLDIGPKETVYWIAVPDAGKRSHMVSLVRSDRPTTVSTTRFGRCDSHGQASASRGGFKSECQQVTPRDTMMVEHTSPPWITCANGCCYADGS